MSSTAEAEFYAEEQRHMATLVALIDKYPEYRRHFACALLGTAVATCDTFGVDVEAWLKGLREREPKPDVLVPPKEKTS